MLGAILNAANAVTIIASVWLASERAAEKHEPRRVVFRYFTVLSNLLCAAASVIAAVFHAAGGLSLWASVLKYVSTCAVTVTFATVMLFLGPAYGGVKELIKGEDLFLHVICPLLALATYCLFDKTKIDSRSMLLGVLPVLLYGLLYLYKVLLAPKDRRWEDFYTFNRGGKWPVSFAAMLLGALAVSAFLKLI